MILLLFTLVFIGLTIFLLKDGDYSDNFGWGILSAVITVILLIFNLCLFFNPNTVHCQMKEREAFRYSINEARKDTSLTSSFKKEFIVSKIIEWNTWTVEQQYDNKHIYQIYTPDEVDTMTLIK